MTRAQIDPMPEYFERYIQLSDDADMFVVIRKSLAELDELPLGKWAALGDQVYAPGKWTIKDILQHLIDTERIFAYRALAFARGEAQHLPPFSEDDYATHALASRRSLEDLIAEMKTLRQSFLELFQSFTPEMLRKTGMGFKGEYSVASIGFIIPGHQRWHFKVLEERYYPLLGG